MNEQKIADRLAREVTAAAEIPISELPADRQAIAKKLGMKIIDAWDGIHGYIIMLKGNMGTARMDAGDLKRLASDSNFRWLDASGRGQISIGC